MDLVWWFLSWTAGSVGGKNRSTFTAGDNEPRCFTPGPTPLVYQGQDNIKAHLFTNYTFPMNGKLIGFRWYNKVPNATFWATIYRKVEGWDKHYELRFKTELESDKVGLSEGMINAETAFKIEEGDFLGLHYRSAVSKSTVPLAEAGKLCADENGKERCLESGDLYKTHSLPLSDGNLWVGEIVGMDNIDGIPGKETNMKAPALNPIFCLGEPPYAPNRPACHYPFTYKNEQHVACTDLGSPGAFWCATAAEYSTDDWRPCDENDLYVEKMPCHFPFLYDKVHYNSCIKANSMTFWCVVSEEFGPRTWRECTEEDPKPHDLPCHYPYLYQDAPRNMCIKDGAMRHWCAVSDRYGQDTWKECGETDRVPSNMPCHFPFSTDHQTFDECKIDRTGRPWCSVEAQFREDNWRFCKHGDKFPERERCHFPFKYQGKDRTKCLTANSAHGWCGTTYDYDAEKEFTFCVDVDVTVEEGDGPLTVETAKELCKSKGRDLATDYDRTGGFELGAESCGCAIADDGKVYDLVRNVACQTGKDLGLQACEGEATKALCVLVPIS